MYVQLVFLFSYRCIIYTFASPDNRMIKVNGTREPLEFKSHQWFGATVRTHRGKVVVSISEKILALTRLYQSSNRPYVYVLDGKLGLTVFSIPSTGIGQLVVCEIRARVVDLLDVKSCITYAQQCSQEQEKIHGVGKCCFICKLLRVSWQHKHVVDIIYQLLNPSLNKYINDYIITWEPSLTKSGGFMWEKISNADFVLCVSLKEKLFMLQDDHGIRYDRERKKYENGLQNTVQKANSFIVQCMFINILLRYISYKTQFVFLSSLFNKDSRVHFKCYLV